MRESGQGIVQKLQVVFSKRPELRFISHHDLMRAFRRALRRAGIPVRMTGGFNPRPRIVLPHALEVGISSEDEYAEIELARWMPPAEFAKRLSRALPPELPVGEVRLLPPRKRGSAAVEARYAAELGPDDARAASAGAEDFMAKESWPVERVEHDGSRRRVDLRPHVSGLSVEGTALHLHLKLGRPGAARPREVIAAVLGRPGEAMLDVELRKTKTVLSGPA
ncbi:MAG: TIGR03936 family radical SAM-associated protein [Planctomycetota bacterium]